MTHYRFSKYDPAYRVNGVYTKDEWTDYSDIGKCFDGVILTEAAYLQTENAYLQFCTKLMQMVGVEEMLLRDLSNPFKSDLPWKNNETLSAEQAVAFLCDCLRTKCWGLLKHGALRFYIGYDYYVHFSCNCSIEKLTALAEGMPIFVEEWNRFVLEDA